MTGFNINDIKLNDKQKEAVLCTEGPLLVLAGAGSGKTKVLTHRIAYLIREIGVDPYHIFAITFTNKAAGEMKERVGKLLENSAPGVWVSTFHAACVRILRRHGDVLGYGNSFAIYDTDDQKSLMKQILKKKDVDTKVYKERMFLGKISEAKNHMISPEEYRKRAGQDYALKQIARVYEAYENGLRENNALDFDDLLLKTVELFEKYPEILRLYQERFRYIMVDEYQDTNMVQFRFIELLAERYRNLCVVGDDDQSIYKFRGADIKNILDFEEKYPEARVIRLEQNYRSTEYILNAANEVIKHNRGRKRKTLWTKRGSGEPVIVRRFHTAYDEAEFVANQIRRNVRKGGTYHQHAVLYRTNAQSRLFEEKFINASIPYKLVGGVNFYARREIKDLLSYLKVVDNGVDDLAVMRIINVPKRGIGAATVGRITEFAGNMGISFYEALLEADRIPGVAKSVRKLNSFVSLIEGLKRDAERMKPSELLREILEKTGYEAELLAENTEEAKSRIENIKELMSKVVSFQLGLEEAGEAIRLRDLLEEISLVADVDTMDPGEDVVLLMTVHSAKGLEFPNVFLVGMEEGMFPSYMSINSDDPSDVEEERRLCYVGITRAQNLLTITSAQSRMVNGSVMFNPLSSFVEDIPDHLIEPEEKPGLLINGEKRPVDHKVRDAFANDAYRTAKNNFKAKAYQSVGVSPAGLKTEGVKTQGLSYDAGDRVAHLKFGEGIVLSINALGRDYEVTVEFDRFGVKKMFAGFAKLRKV